MSARALRKGEAAKTEGRLGHPKWVEESLQSRS